MNFTFPAEKSLNLKQTHEQIHLAANSTLSRRYTNTVKYLEVKREIT